MLRIGTKEYLTISEAAEQLGVNKLTLKRYTERGFLPERRHELNSYRLYLQQDVDSLIEKLQEAAL